ncbi:MAG TPA: hypothetical protein VIV60_12690 [Polyangiaceae bacterium]
MATKGSNDEIAIQRIADIAMVDRRYVQKALRGEFVRGAEGQRVAVALRALGVSCVIHPNLALELKALRVPVATVPNRTQKVSLSHSLNKRGANPPDASST